MKLIEQNLALLKSKVPFQTQYGVVSSVFDIEEGSVRLFLEQQNFNPVTTRALRLKHARDSLPVPLQLKLYIFFEYVA